MRETMTRVRKLRFISLLVMTCALLVFATPGRASAQDGQQCFPETGQCISGRIREFWNQNGGLPVFGFPVGPQQEEQIEGRPFQVQWFERNRLELHPENQRPYDVLLGRLGADRLVQQSRDWRAFPKNSTQPGCRFFPETAHNVCGDILKAWHASGLEIDGRRGKSEAENLALFGLPLSDPMTETLSDGKQYTVQWFERARFEIHPENASPYNVLLGLLGNEVRPGAGGTPPANPPAASCTDVPDPVSGRIQPGKCINQGEIITMDIFGFQPNEQVGYWLTAPDGSVVGTIATQNIGSTGEVDGLEFDTQDLPPGLWFWVFQGTSTKHQSIIYFKVLKP